MMNLNKGKEYSILYGRNKRPVARLSPMKKARRKIGLLDGIAKFSENGNGKITEEEFLGL